MENPITMDDFGVPHFWKPPIVLFCCVSASQVPVVNCVCVNHLNRCKTCTPLAIPFPQLTSYVYTFRNFQQGAQV